MGQMLMQFFPLSDYRYDDISNIQIVYGYGGHVILLGQRHYRKKHGKINSQNFQLNCLFQIQKQLVPSALNNSVFPTTGDCFQNDNKSQLKLLLPEIFQYLQNTESLKCLSLNKNKYTTLQKPIQRIIIFLPK